MNCRLILLFLIILTFVRAEIDRRDDAQTVVEFKIVNKGRMYHHTVLMFRQDIDIDECFLLCVQFLSCVTVSYNSPKRWCELNDMDFDKDEADVMDIDWYNYGTPPKVDGEFSEWKTTTSCSRSCGGGVVVYRRSCDSPKPQYGGENCVGEEVKTGVCNTQSCPDSCQVNPESRVSCGELDQTACEKKGCCYNPNVHNYQPLFMCYQKMHPSPCQVNPESRRECGGGGEEVCTLRGCCFNSNTRAVRWCYHKNE